MLVLVVTAWRAPWTFANLTRSRLFTVLFEGSNSILQPVTETHDSSSSWFKFLVLTIKSTFLCLYYYITGHWQWKGNLSKHNMLLSTHLLEKNNLKKLIYYSQIILSFSQTILFLMLQRKFPIHTNSRRRDWVWKVKPVCYILSAEQRRRLRWLIKEVEWCNFRKKIWPYITSASSFLMS